MTKPVYMKGVKDRRLGLSDDTPGFLTQVLSAWVFRPWTRGVHKGYTRGTQGVHHGQNILWANTGSTLGGTLWATEYVRGQHGEYGHRGAGPRGVHRGCTTGKQSCPLGSGGYPHRGCTTLDADSHRPPSPPRRLARGPTSWKRPGWRTSASPRRRARNLSRHLPRR